MKHSRLLPWDSVAPLKTPRVTWVWRSPESVNYFWFFFFFFFFYFFFFFFFFLNKKAKRKREEKRTPGTRCCLTVGNVEAGEGVCGARVAADGEEAWVLKAEVEDVGDVAVGI